MQKDSAADLKVLQEWFETNRIRETGIIENVQKQPASTERDEMLEICIIISMKWKIFSKKNSSSGSRRQILENYEQEYISRLKQDIDSEFL